MTRSIALRFVLTLAPLIASGNAIPTKDEPDAYAQALVHDSIRLYNSGRPPVSQRISEAF